MRCTRAYCNNEFVCDQGDSPCCGLCSEHCPTGERRTLEMRSLASVDELTIVKINKLYEKDEYHNNELHGAPVSVKTHQGNGTYQGQFAFTLTKSPEDELTEFDMIKAARKIMNQKSCPVIKFAWYLEYGDNDLQTHPHIHGMYETETQGRIEAKHFKRAWPIWDEKRKMGRGFRGGYHRPVRSEEGYADYIKKDSGKSELFNVE